MNRIKQGNGEGQLERQNIQVGLENIFTEERPNMEDRRRPEPLNREC
jgi:hypothetical protein